MKKIRIFCAAMTIAVIGTFGSVALAADNTLKVADNLPQQKLPAFTDGTVAVVEQQEVQVAMLSGFAEVTELAPDEVDSAFIVVKPEAGDYAGQEIRLNIAADSLLMSNKDAKTLNPKDIAVGDRVYVYFSQAMTRSIPPQSRLYLLLADVDEGTPAKLWTAEAVEADVSGDLVVTTDNGGLLVRLPKDAWIGEAKEVKVGERFLAWYDIVALSYPGQATANKAMIPPAADLQTTDAAADYDDFAAVNPAVAVVTTQAVVKEIVNEDDNHYLLVERGEGLGDLQLNFATEGENAALLVDAQTGNVVDWTAIKPGEKVVAGHNAATTFSLPPQSWLNYVLVNVGDDAPAGLFTVEQIQDGRVLVDNGGLWIDVKAVHDCETADCVGLQEGSLFLAWYDVVAESYPGQTTATNFKHVFGAPEVCELPLAPADTDTTKLAGASKLLLDDMVFTDKVHYTNGVAMVPVRIVATELGFDVDWEAATQTIHLTNGEIQTDLTVGLDSYYYATAIPGMVGMSAPTSFGAAPEWQQDGIYVPADLFDMLGATVSVSGDTMKIK